jgi:hypothetical protein
MITTLTKSQLAELLSQANAEKKQLDEDNRTLVRRNMAMQNERDLLFRTIKEGQDSKFSDIDTIIYYGLNWHYDFIDLVWENDPSLVNHLKGKMKTCTEGINEDSGTQYRITFGIFTRFLTMLDSANREKLYDWILRNHKESKRDLTSRG